MRACQKTRANHFQAVSPGFATPQHESRRLEGMLQHGRLTFVEFEVNDLPRLRFPARKMAFYFSLKFFFRQLFGLVQPGCTIEIISISTCHFGHLGGFTPTDLLEMLFWNAGQILVNSHQVISLPSRLGEALLQVLVE